MLEIYLKKKGRIKTNERQTNSNGNLDTQFNNNRRSNCTNQENTALWKKQFSKI